MDLHDDDLKQFEAHGAAPLPVASGQGYLDNDGALIWYATYGSGSPVILLHGASAIAAIGAIRSQRWSAPAIAPYSSIAAAMAAVRGMRGPFRMS